MRVHSSPSCNTFSDNHRLVPTGLQQLRTRTYLLIPVSKSPYLSYLLCSRIVIPLTTLSPPQQHQLLCKPHKHLALYHSLPLPPATLTASLVSGSISKLSPRILLSAAHVASSGRSLSGHAPLLTASYLIDTGGMLVLSSILYILLEHCPLDPTVRNVAYGTQWFTKQMILQHSTSLPAVSPMDDPWICIQ